MAKKEKKIEPHRLNGQLKQVIDPTVAKALSHPLRSHILMSLGDRVASPNEIARELGLEPRDLNYHVNVLVEMSMIRLVGTEKRRGAKEHFYELSEPNVYIDDHAWKRIPQEIRSSFSASLLQMVLDEAVEALRAGTFGARGSHQSRTPMILDERGWREVTNVMEVALERLSRIGEESKRRQEKGRKQAFPFEVYMVGFETAVNSGQPTKGPRRA